MKIYCHRCGKHTNHEIIAEKIIDLSLEDEPNEIYEKHYFSSCKGCDAINYAIKSWSVEDMLDDPSELYASWKTYPHDALEQKMSLEWHDLPSGIASIYAEIIGSINANLPILSGVGLRILIEAICSNQSVSGKNLEEKIDGLAEKGVLSRSQASMLHKHRWLGNAAAHEVIAARKNEIQAALIIAESMMKTIYVLPELSRQITTGVKRNL